MKKTQEFRVLTIAGMHVIPAKGLEAAKAVPGAKVVLPRRSGQCAWFRNGTRWVKGPRRLSDTEVLNNLRRLFVSES